MLVGGVLSLPLVPGPGILLVLLGLCLLKDEFAWARRATEWTSQRARNIASHGPFAGR
jgi:hypothetical protein